MKKLILFVSVLVKLLNTWKNMTQTQKVKIMRVCWSVCLMDVTGKTWLNFYKQKIFISYFLKILKHQCYLSTLVWLYLWDLRTLIHGSYHRKETCPPPYIHISFKHTDSILFLIIVLWKNYECNLGGHSEKFGDESNIDQDKMKKYLTKNDNDIYHIQEIHFRQYQAI